MSSNFALNPLDYDNSYAIWGGLATGHFKKAFVESGVAFGHRFVHSLIALTELIPVIGQIAALFEKFIVSRQLAIGSSSPKNASSQILTTLPYPNDLSAIEKQALTMMAPNADNLTFKFANASQTQLNIRAQNIFNSGAEVIVNAANTHLGGGGGIDGLIHEKGGKAYTKEHFKLARRF